MENHKKSYEFFLSELFKGDEPELGYIIELMRAAGHINEIQKLLSFVSTPDSTDEDEILEYEVELESLRVYLFNVTAAQLREALKLFHKFTKLPFYDELRDDFNEEQKITVSALENYVNISGFTVEGRRAVIYLSNVDHSNISNNSASNNNEVIYFESSSHSNTIT